MNMVHIPKWIHFIIAAAYVQCIVSIKAVNSINTKLNRPKISTLNFLISIIRFQAADNISGVELVTGTRQSAQALQVQSLYHALRTCQDHVLSLMNLINR